jgi:phosphoribosylanthranilate isomerase
VTPPDPGPEGIGRPGPVAPGTPAKICGLTRTEDARLAATLGAAWVGVVLVPGTPRARTPAEARVLGDAARGAAGTPLALVVADLPADLAARAAEEAGAGALQLHGSEEPGDLEALRARGPWELWKAVRVRSGAEILPAALRWAGVADLLLLDGWHPRALGGTGAAFDWAALEAVRAAWPRGLRLGVAGGLRADTVGEAVARLRPDLVDVSSGVELRPGVKDPELLGAFLSGVSAPPFR